MLLNFPFLSSYLPHLQHSIWSYKYKYCHVSSASTFQNEIIIWMFNKRERKPHKDTLTLYMYVCVYVCIYTWKHLILLIHNLIFSILLHTHIHLSKLYNTCEWECEIIIITNQQTIFFHHYYYYRRGGIKACVYVCVFGMKIIIIQTNVKKKYKEKEKLLYVLKSVEAYILISFKTIRFTLK